MSWLDQRPDDAMMGSFEAVGQEHIATVDAAQFREAMAQLGGGLAFTSQAFLTGIDGCEVDRAIEPGDVIRFVVTLDANFGGTFRFSGSGAIDGVEVIRGRFYLASPDA